MRPFLNWGVALFLFLSGLLTPRSKVGNLKSFYGRRIHKILIPWLCPKSCANVVPPVRGAVISSLP